MLELILITAGATAFGCTIVGALFIGQAERSHGQILKAARAELDRAYRRIENLERMLDESRASVLGVSPTAIPEARSKPLPAEVLAELDEIEGDAIRAELEADIRVELELHPEQEPLAVARRVIGG